MEDLLKLKKHFDRVKIFTIVALVSLAGICVASMMMSYKNAREFSKRIYVVNRNEQFEAMAATLETNRPVEIGYHVRRFHELFFTVVPDAEEIEANAKRAFFLADESARKLFGDLKEQNFYTELIQGNVVQKVAVDSVIINSATYPYQAITYATITQTRATSKATKNIVTRCTLEDTPRTVNSPNGLFMRNLRITKSQVGREY